MKDINKIKIIHDLKNTFGIDELTLKKFTEQIDNSEYKDNIERFFAGYTIEDNFHILFSAMPWVKLVHGLAQDQLPYASKNKYQVPDFTLLFETSKKAHKPILMEVKSVKGDSQGIEIMTKQLKGCVDYAQTTCIPLLYAIYWEKYQTWTFNTVENFEVKAKQHRLKIFDALKNDLSVIVGDINYLITQPIFRKTICDRSITDISKPQHEKFGAILSDTVSMDNQRFIELEHFESALIDANIKMKVSDTKKDGDRTTITEVSDNNYFLKLSTAVLRHVAIFGFKLTEQNVDISRRTIVELFKKLGVPISYTVPAVKSPTSTILYQQAFEDSWVLDHYNSAS